MPDETLFGPATDDDAVLTAVYERLGRTLDDLPYTDDFETLYAAASPLAPLSKSELFHRLHNLRKSGRLPRLGRATSDRVKIDAQQEALLVRLVEDAVGKLSLRDRLPYTEAFDLLVDRFNADAGLSLSHHDAWRIIARLAK